jgi:hypothetical protein
MISTHPPIACKNMRLPRPYVEPLSVATCLREALRRRQGTPLADFSNSLLYFSPDRSPNIPKIVHQLFEL